jgi:hypothetical protein
MSHRIKAFHWIALALAGFTISMVVRADFTAPTPSQPSRFEAPVELTRFFRGNTHTHSTRSDGDSSPERVVSWYRDHGYQFVVLTDHSRASRQREFRAQENASFVAVAGEEVTYNSVPLPSGGQTAPVHVNALCAKRTMPWRSILPPSRALQAAVSGIVAQDGAVAQINHPNYMWALKQADLLPVRGAALIEIFNQQPDVRNEGDSRHPSTEALWDGLLSRGQRLYGVASDDMHELIARPGSRRAHPGQGWVQVDADDLSDESLCRALEEGRFYSSTGVELARVSAREDELSLEIRASDGRGYVTEFVGQDGAVLARRTGLAPSYRLQGGERYVRARVTGPRGRHAWTQPVFVRQR